MRPQAEGDSLAFWAKFRKHCTRKSQAGSEEPLWHNKIGFLVTCGLPLQAIFDLAQGQGKKAFDYALYLTHQGHTEYPRRRSGRHTVLRQQQPQSHAAALLLLFNIRGLPTAFHSRSTLAPHSPGAYPCAERPGLDPQSSGRPGSRAPPGLERHPTQDNSAAIDPLLADIDAAVLPHLHTRQFGLEEFKALRQVLVVLNGGVEEEADHSIANLALLSLGANAAALSNAVFEVKRCKVLAMDGRGDYIPAATRNVFLKYYAPADRLQPHFWGDADKDAYLREIKKKLAAYLQ